jgi:proteic killer suppression protein
LVKAYGERQARKIMKRISVLRTAASIREVPTAPPDRCHALTGDRAGQYAVDLEHPYRLVFRPYMDPPSGTSSVNRSSVTSIEIVTVEDYH